ncbi:hypothetical protein [Shimia sediminis]|uniref:hypothetical protein n=1 Tax=Shimia sediminis TaxID=2497945 RepID=UPI0013DFDE3F|nr:hypothetical protein [Shimia sediminis]
MTLAQSYHAQMLAGALAAAGLAGCAMDSEAAVRDELGQWVAIGATLHFDSRLSCTAARFETLSPHLLVGVRVASDLRDALQDISAGHSVAFAFANQSPTAVSEMVMSADLPDGLGLLSAGVGGKDCMDDAEQARYVAALNDTRVMMIYSPRTNAVTLLDPTRNEVFFVRGDV